MATDTVQMNETAESSSTSAVRVLLVEDHEVVRAGLKVLLEASGDFDVCGEAAGVSEGIAAAQASRPDLAVIDVNLVDGTGITLFASCGSSNPTFRV